MKHEKQQYKQYRLLFTLILLVFVAIWLSTVSYAQSASGSGGGGAPAKSASAVIANPNSGYTTVAAVENPTAEQSLKLDYEINRTNESVNTVSARDVRADVAESSLSEEDVARLLGCRTFSRNQPNDGAHIVGKVN